MEIGKLQQGIGVRSHHDITWCNARGESSDPATQKALNCITKVKDGKFYATANDVVFRNPNAFVAGEIHHHYDTWDRISQGYHKKKEILRYIANGVSIHDFFTPFQGDFKGQHYNSELPPRIELATTSHVRHLISSLRTQSLKEFEMIPSLFGESVHSVLHRI